MSQDEVIKVLKSNPTKWFSVSELAQLIGIEKSPLGYSLRKLRKYNEVFWKVGGYKGLEYFYQYKETDGISIASL